MYPCLRLVLLKPRLLTRRIGESLPQELSEGFSTRGRRFMLKTIWMYLPATIQGMAAEKKVMTVQVLSGL